MYIMETIGVGALSGNGVQYRNEEVSALPALGVHYWLQVNLS